MRKFYPYLALALVLFLLWSMSASFSRGVRASAAALAAPLWRLIVAIHPSNDTSDARQELALLRAENSRLKLLVHQELVLLEQLAFLHENEQLQDASDKHRGLLIETLAQQLTALPARVIFRTPATWNSSLWLNVGASDNKALGYTAVGINSTVLCHGAIVGIVDYVGEKQCRVRLLSDAGLTPAVRVARGSWHDSWLSQQLLLLQRQLAGREELISPLEKETLLSILASLGQRLSASKECWLLAKGELHGSSAPLWRRPGSILKGIGFNYDFADEEGPARDLRSGVVSGTLPPGGELPLVKVKDLLITTGYDGVFPAGLPVAEVTKISPLGEGDYYYELEALPAAGDLTDIDLVSVLPPVTFDTTDHPPTIVW